MNWSIYSLGKFCLLCSLIGMMSGCSEYRRHVVAKKIAHINKLEVEAGTNGLVSVTALQRMLAYEKDSFVRSHIATAFGNLASLSNAQVDIIVVGELAKHLHENPFVTREAAQSLGKFGNRAAAALPDLVRVVESREESDTARFAAQAIGEIGAPGTNAIPALIKACAGPSDTGLPTLSQFAAEAIFKLAGYSGTNGVLIVEAIPRCGKEPATWLALSGLKKGSHDPAVIEALRKALSPDETRLNVIVLMTLRDDPLLAKNFPSVLQKHAEALKNSKKSSIADFAKSVFKE